VIGGKSEYWGNSYGYDAWGNLLQKSVTKCGAENLIVTADAHNWIHASGTDYQYDAAGNMTFNATAPAQTYTYDQENRLTGAAGYAYTYDGDGNRVRKSSGSTGTLYWYMTPGIVGESDLSGNLTDEYVFFDGERVARKSTNGVFYYFSDHLKTASVITDSAGNIKSESDFYPWGGELQFVNNDSNHYKFTGKERDGETQLDYFGARYYSNGLGRFVTPDWSAMPEPVPYADLTDPQSLNQYSYVRNLPTTKFDADGHCDWCQQLKNKLLGNGWKTDAQVIEDHRQQMINDFSARPDFQKQLKEMKPDQVDKLWGCLHSTECTQQMVDADKAAAAAAAAASKPVNLPSYKDINIDMEHITSGHTEGGSRVSPNKDLFPKTMSEKAIERAVREAYKNGSKLATQGERVLVEGKGAGLTIRMWVNKVTRTIESAWPK
jgi:RHS repeat-associated protein